MRLIIRDVEAASSSLATPMDGNSCVSRGSFFCCSFPVHRRRVCDHRQNTSLEGTSRC